MRTQWFDQRAGHTAASTLYNVCHTSTDTPSLSLTRCICYPHDNQVIAPQLKYTRQNKASGLAKYKHLIKELHRDLRSHQAGLLIYEEFVFWEQLRFCWWSIAAVAAPVVPGTLRLKKKKSLILLPDPGATICMKEGVLWFCCVELQWGTCLKGKRRQTVPASIVACSRGFFQNSPVAWTCVLLVHSNKRKNTCLL